MPSQQPSPSEIRAAHAKAVGGARPRCNIGKSCSAACITRTDFCLVEIPASPAQAISKVRTEIESAKTRQLPLFDVSKKLKKADIQEAVDNFRKENQRNILEAVSKGLPNDYDKHRQAAIAFNRRLVEDGLDKKAGLVKVPVTWERLQQVKASYEKAHNLIRKRAISAASSGKRKEYLREERKLMELERKFKDKVGSKLTYNSTGLPQTDKYTKGAIWYDWYESASKQKSFVRSLERNPLLSNYYTVDLMDQGTRVDIDRFIRGDSRTHRLSIMLSDRGTSLAFTINGGYDRPKDVTRRDGIKMSLAVRDAFKEITKSMAVGSVITCYPYEDDGFGEKRKALYKQAGFKEGKDGTMFAKVIDKAGNVAPATEEDYLKFLAKGRFAFSESAVNMPIEDNDKEEFSWEEW